MGDMKIRARMILGDRDNPSEGYYIRGASDLALVTKIEAAIKSVKEEKETLDPITGNLLDLTNQKSTLDNLYEQLKTAKADPRKIKETDRKIEIIRMSDGQSMEKDGFTKGDLEDIIFRSVDPKYLRYKHERHKVKLKDDDHPYIIQTFYDAGSGKKYIRLYRRSDMKNEDFEKDKVFEIELIPEDSRTQSDKARLEKYKRDLNTLDLKWR